MDKILIYILLVLVIGCQIEQNNKVETTKNEIVSEPMEETETLSLEDVSKFKHNGEGDSKDMNLDGFKDFTMYSEENSGSGGAYYNTYVFNSDKKVFEFSKLHSGGELTLDTIKRTLTSTWRSGVAINIYKILYFDDEGKIKYRERIVTEMFEYIDDKNFKQTAEYQKIINDKVILEKIDTSIYTDN